MFRVFSRALCVCIPVLFSTAAFAQLEQSPEPRGDLTLGAAVELALRRNPDLVASRYELTAAQARIVQAGLRLNPEIGVEHENFAGTSEASGISVLETTLSLSLVIELGNKRGLRRSVAEADRDVVTIEQRARQLDVLAEVTRRFIDVTSTQERVKFAAEATRFSQQTFDTITARVQSARSPQAEASRARIALTRAALQERQSAAELRSARYALAAMWGGSEPQFTQANADLFAFKEIQPFNRLVEQVERNPDLLLFASASRLRDAELRLAQAQARPNLALSVGVRRFEEFDGTALVAGFSMPLPVYDRNQGAISEARARRAQTDAERQSTLTRTRASLYGIYQEVVAARERAETLRRDGIPQAQTALEQTQSGYDRGRFSFLELLSAQQELLELRVAVIDAATDYHRLLAELERVTSEPLTTTDLEAPLP